MAYSFLVRYLCVEFACRTGVILTGIFLVKVIAAISDFFSREGSGKKEIFTKGLPIIKKKERGGGGAIEISCCLSIAPPQIKKALQSL